MFIEIELLKSNWASFEEATKSEENSYLYFIPFPAICMASIQ